MEADRSAGITRGRTGRGLPWERIELVPAWRRPGRPVLLHHGIGATSELWTPWLLALAERHPVIRFDMRGFGRAAELPLAGTALLETMIGDVREVVSAAAPVHLVGESAGGTIVLAVALRHPELAASVTISNAAFAGQGIGQIDGWRKLFQDGGAKGWSERMMECRFAPGALDAQALQWFATQQEQTAPAAALAVADMLAATDLRAGLATLGAPLLILAPDQSPFVPVAMAQELHSCVPGSELHVFPGVRHGLPFSHAAACVRRLRDFLQRVEAAR